jgi:hypothetical protein
MISGQSLCRLVMNRWQFEQLIDALDGPDWWSIGITIVNALIMVWLGISQYKLQKRQTELQQRQTEAQEYEIYKRLYMLLVQVHNEVNEFMHNVSFGTWGTYYQADKELLVRKEKSINQLKNDLLTNYVDYELKFSKGLFDKEAYRQILNTMSAILFHVNQAIEKDEVNMPVGSQQITSIDGDMEKGEASALAGRFKYTEFMLQGFMNFVNQKRRLGSCEEALKVIKEKCKID